MKYNPEIHKRQSIRLKGYDYSRQGLYFVTICAQHRECLFGKIENQKIVLNDAGTMIEKWYGELMNKFADIKCDTMVIMPNHFHCIIQNVGAVGSAVGSAVGADLCVCPGSSLGEHTGSPLHRVIQWFKTMTTNEYIRGVKNLGWRPFNGKLWQRNYYEHIIRNQKSYEHISNYIVNNPLHWEQDSLFGGDKKT